MHIHLHKQTTLNSPWQTHAGSHNYTHVCTLTHTETPLNYLIKTLSNVDIKCFIHILSFTNNKKTKWRYQSTRPITRRYVGMQEITAEDKTNLTSRRQPEKPEQETLIDSWSIITAAPTLAFTCCDRLRTPWGLHSVFLLGGGGGGRVFFGG